MKNIRNTKCTQKRCISCLIFSPSKLRSHETADDGDRAILQNTETFIDAKYDLGLLHYVVVGDTAGVSEILVRP
jgi:hypothetical protein